jgi:multiple sugar transport system ATP-binding protein
MRAELKHMQYELGITTIYVTHDQIEAMTLAHRVALMDKGVLQQLAPPAGIYSDPANLFVAGFIGSPPMNFLRGQLADDVFQAPSVRVTTSRSSDAADVILGVRPEDCTLVDLSRAQLEGRIYSIELIGDHTLVTLKAGEQEVVVKAPNTFSAEMGSSIGLSFDTERVYLFRAASGERIR